ncbi:phosphoribosylglycinamide formyltransferase [candidate division KSB1 bacterium]|nr:phosphoribosylglycinamide formyltransferase [candidate division KSB1 bacterium]
MNKLKLAILASGRGSNFEAILTNIQQKKLDAAVQIVISNNSKAGVLELARKNDIPAMHLSHRQFDSPEQFDEKLLSVLKECGANFIVLAGYMKLLSAKIIGAYRNRILNIHPALLPSFGGKGMYGIHVHEAVLAYGCKVTGVTVHLVDEKFDHGAPIIQRCVPVLSDDTPQTLAQRVLGVEHQVFTEALRLFAENRIEIRGRSAFIHQ